MVGALWEGDRRYALGNGVYKLFNGCLEDVISI